jgi:tRNA nucleotidyltransferase (CCA-adding enzyme)
MDAAAVLRWDFWSRWAESARPGELLAELRSARLLSQHPELDALPDVQQDPLWHPEGDVWIHTLHVCDAAAAISIREQLEPPERQTLLLAALCHDFGKPATTIFAGGRWKSPGHPQAGVPLAESFLRRVDAPDFLLAAVLPLVAEHLAHAQPNLNSTAIRRLLRRLWPASLQQLIRLIEADLSGRPPLPCGLSAELRQFAERSIAVQESMSTESSTPAVQPVILGRHLIALGFQPGVHFGRILQTCLEAQIRGEFATEAGGLDYLKRVLRSGE